ncbi:flagellar basal body L-ring protein FlgH [Paenirhodobacter populi]|uniref:Flagellar L-ring protein n=1 Tax=Paenirhodobacter populi TaxID=2306993 RepID=A0A443IVX7_9RHOB|nr:flagellar basal body L-ring protein FlgH [Sinirhodobacter populi]RWR09034.1 flagellar basal body L-ring protein FlgH [Sinirhodobacter populi]RWR12292.1 flagellar basal body L-ring protein FlgH [Sinirhodobacter populi]RWR28226.1 flagellar basal body L-ring protein FlgH [Sinirhodobacter populi]
MQTIFRSVTLVLLVTAALGGCQRLGQVGKTPAFTPVEASNEFFALNTTPMPEETARVSATRQASLWSGSRGSLLGDRRAATRGDILTVVIEINDKAEISNTTDRSRAGSDTMGIPQMFGIPQRVDNKLPDGASMANAYQTNSKSSYEGSGSVARKEKLTLRVAATVLDRLPNGAMRIQGSQEVRVNFEVRELVVTGFVRPEDVTRQNEVTYDKIAGARIAYGGRGQITDVQQPRIGQQVSDILLPF